MNQSTLRPDLRRPRPNPCFAGVERLLVIGVDNLAQGISKGHVGLIVAGLLIIFLAVGFWVAAHYSPMVQLWCYRFKLTIYLHLLRFCRYINESMAGWANTRVNHGH